MTFEIDRLTNENAFEWDAIVENSPHGTIFHKWAWLKTIETHTRSELFPLLVKKPEGPVGIIPLFFQKKSMFRMVFSPPPHVGLFYLGPVLIETVPRKQGKWEEDYLEFHQAVDQFIKNELRPDYISISLPPTLSDPRPYGWSGYHVEPFYDYVSDLTKGEDYLFSTLSKRQRQGVNRSLKKGAVVTVGGKEEFSVVLDLMNKRYEEQERIVPVKNAYFLDIYDRFKDNITVFTVNFENEILTGLIDIHYHHEVFSWIGNPKPRAREGISPNELLLWEAIRYGCKSGCQSYITPSAAGNQRLHNYYSAKYDPKLVIRFLAKKQSFAAGLSEKGYSNIAKPVIGKLKSLTRRHSG
jgi:hypothetical protein